MKIYANFHLVLILLGLIIISPAAFADETPLTQKYLNWTEASEKDSQAMDSFTPQAELCYENIVGDQERIPREKAVSLYECRKQAAEENLTPHAMFPNLLREYYAAQIQTATDYQNGKIEREEANEKNKEAEDRLFMEYAVRSNSAEKAVRYFECSALYYVAGETQEEASPWYESIAKLAYETMQSSVMHLNMAYTAPKDAAYFKSSRFDDDLAQALREEEQYWRTSVRSDTPYLRKTMNNCFDLLNGQQDFMDFMKAWMESEEL